MEELQERTVLKRRLMGSGVSLSREEQGKNKVKIAVFFWSQPAGEHREQDVDQLPVWVTGWRTGTGWAVLSPSRA